MEMANARQVGEGLCSWGEGVSRQSAGVQYGCPYSQCGPSRVLEHRQADEAQHAFITICCHALGGHTTTGRGHVGHVFRLPPSPYTHKNTSESLMAWMVCAS
jgi:hypothetical protein